MRVLEVPRFQCAECFEVLEVLVTPDHIHFTGTHLATAGKDVQCPHVGEWFKALLSEFERTRGTSNEDADYSEPSCHDYNE